MCARICTHMHTHTHTEQYFPSAPPQPVSASGRRSGAQSACLHLPCFPCPPPAGAQEELGQAVKASSPPLQTASHAPACSPLLAAASLIWRGYWRVPKYRFTHGTIFPKAGSAEQSQNVITNEILQIIKCVFLARSVSSEISF